MFGVLLLTFATLFEEASSSIGKYRMERREQSVPTSGFLSHIGGFAIIAAIALWVPLETFGPNFPGGFVFSAASLPTFVPRLICEILLAHITLHAVLVASRSTFGFLRTLTLPLLLAIDIFLGYPMAASQMVGIGLIAISLLVLFLADAPSMKGAWLVVASATLAVATATLYKYNITYFNSVEAEQLIVTGVIIIYFLVLMVRRGENPAGYLLHPIYFVQYAIAGASLALQSFAYLYVNASVFMAAKRSLSIFWAILTGATYFHERHVALKVSVLVTITLGIVLLVA